MKKVDDKFLLDQLNGVVNIDPKAGFTKEDLKDIKADYDKQVRERVTDQALLDQLNSAPEKPSESWGAVGTRMSSNALSALPEFLIDLPLQSVGKMGNAINRATGYPANLPEPTPFKWAKEKYLQQFGVNPDPGSTTERIAQAGLNAATSAGMAGASHLPSILASLPSRQVAGAMSGVAAQEAAKESGAGETAQMIANIGGGFLGSNAMGMVEGAGKGIGNAGKVLLTEDGKDLVAARALYRQTTNPDLTIAALENPRLRQQYIKGSVPITAEIAQDPGISMLGKSFASNPVAIAEGLDQLHNQRLGDIANLTNDLLDKVNRVKPGGEDFLNKIGRIKKASVDKFEEGKDLSGTPVDVSGINRSIANQLDNFQGNSAIEAYLAKVGANITPNDPSAGANFRRVWNARKALDEDLYQTTSDPKAHATLKDSMDVAAGNIRPSFNEALIQADPAFEDFLRRYAFASDLGTKIKTGRNIADKIKTSATTARSNAEDATGSRGVSAFQATKIGDMLTDVAGNPSELAGRLTKRQLAAFENIAKEQERAKALTSLGSSVGSPTASYIGRGGLLYQDVLDGIIGQQGGSGSSVPRMLLEGIGKGVGKTGLLDPMEAEVMRRIGAGAIDPDIALAMLKRGRDNALGPMNLGKSAYENSRVGLVQSLINR